MSGGIRRRVLVSGRVQGVGFRASTVAQASRHAGIRGFVRNLDDGRVEAVFQGPEAEVLALVAWCKQGPPSARVTALEVREEDVDPSLDPFGVTPY